MNEHSVIPPSVQTRDPSTATPPLLSRWWIAVPCLLGAIALGAQAWTIRGHLHLLMAGQHLSNLQSQTVDLETEISALKLQRRQLQSDLATSQPALEDLRQQTAIENAKFADAERKREQAEQRANERDAETKVLAAANKTMTARIGELKQERAQLDEENSRLDAHHADLLEKIGTAEGRLRQLARQITSATGELTRLNDNLSIQQEALAELVAHVGTKTAEVKRLTDDQDRLRRENARLSSDNAGIQTTYGAAIKRLAELETQHKGLRDDIRREGESLSSLRSQAETLGASTEVLDAKVAELQTKVADKKQELDDLTVQIEIQTQLTGVKIKELQSSDADLKAKLEELSLVAARINRAKLEETGLLKRLADLRSVVERNEPAEPIEATTSPPASPTSSELGVAQPSEATTLQPGSESKESPKE